MFWLPVRNYFQQSKAHKKASKEKVLIHDFCVENAVTSAPKKASLCVAFHFKFLVVELYVWLFKSLCCFLRSTTKKLTLGFSRVASHFIYPMCMIALSVIHSQFHSISLLRHYLIIKMYVELKYRSVRSLFTRGEAGWSTMNELCFWRCRWKAFFFSVGIFYLSLARRFLHKRLYVSSLRHFLIQFNMPHFCVETSVNADDDDTVSFEHLKRAKQFFCKSSKINTRENREERIQNDEPRMKAWNK